MFKHREFGILSRRPPLQWCRELRYLTDPEKPAIVTQQTTPKPISFMKKYEKYLRKDAASSVTNSNALSDRKSNNDILTDNYQKIRSDSGFQTKAHLSNDKIARVIKYNNDDTKQIYYEKLWPKTNNLRKKLVKATETPETGLTALASFPVRFHWIILF